MSTKRQITKRQFAVGGVVILALVLAACAPTTEPTDTQPAEPTDTQPAEPTDTQPPEEPPDGEEIRIGFLAPLTGPLAHSGQDSVNGQELFWELHGTEVAGRQIRTIVADTGCDPDNAITQTRRLINQEDVHFIIGPLCGHEGPAVQQVSRETGIPVLMSIAAADEITQTNLVDTVIRTGFTASQVSHPFGEYAYDELGCRQASTIGQDYAFGQDNIMGAMATFREAGGTVLDEFWAPIGTTDYGPILGAIPSETDCVLTTVVGTDRLRLLEQWFDFGYNERFEIYGNYWLLADILVEMDDRAVGLIGHSLHWAEGLETPEATEFVNEFAEQYGYVPAYFAENAYTTALWAKTALEAIDGNVEDTQAFLQAVRDAEIVAPRGPVTLDEYDNPIQNVYISEIQVVDHPVLGPTKMNVPIATYEGVSQFWKWDPQEYLENPDIGGPYGR